LLLQSVQSPKQNELGNFRVRILLSAGICGGTRIKLIPLHPDMSSMEFLEQFALSVHEIRCWCSWMRYDAPSSQPKWGNQLTVPSIYVCQKWIPHESDIVAMLANTGLCRAMLALARLCRKKTLSEKKMERLRQITDCPVPNGATLVCVWRMWMAQSPPVSYLGKRIPRRLLRISVRPCIPPG
jgi:hypothetical protein